MGRDEREDMKLKQITTLIVGITSVALSPSAWAAGHGGGGGGSGGGGFNGAPSGGHVGGGGFHSSGQGFSHPGYYYSRGMSFAGSRGRFTQAPWQSPVYRQHPSVGVAPAPINRSVGSNGGRNHAATASAARAPRVSERPALGGRTDHIAERHDANWHGDWDRRHAHFFHHHFFVFDGGFWFGLDDGFFPWDYYPYYAYDYYPYDYYPGYYADVEPYYYDEGVYSETPMVDPTVTAVQTKLTQLGYYNGPADGIYGQTTRDAVANYQIAKNLDVTGSLSPVTLQSLGLPQATSS